ncbi:MAG: TonB C-terminal domain-containing protein [Proteobacteria bacterium]|nr:TonB C-terminal domain-containing protein [Pseudomonadota bacterium]MBU1389909.1 TonB C-terminal domain-containing protein [Pseudomonadota bacterium]MBU1543918.1 TonB C-terminal domain-containing protein [Pseudomonadota bacterium]MBU2429653.1 TonB C-terminal domain-containing protein [Pseudomonadota bacterium]MBU2481977.1 TonB C-terminal domain-containing protein [Pseudomonadota bacterium]
MKSSDQQRKNAVIIGISCLVFVCFLAASIFVLKMLIKDDGHRKKREIQRVTLVKPPPPKIKEKPPEPEIEKKEEIIEPEPEETPEDEMEEPGDEDLPPGDDLGLDSDGTGGADGFGLKAKKGGRSLIGGGSADAALMKRYAWYTRLLQNEIREKVNSYLEKNKELPGGKHDMVLKIQLDDTGLISQFSISRSSGNTQVDDAVQKAIKGHKITEFPPEEMPKIMKIKVTFKS